MNAEEGEKSGGGEGAKGNAELAKLLLDEPSLQVQPCLAVAIGLNEAIALQQLHWVLQNPAMGKVVDGRKYVYMSLSDWRQGHFPFWSEATVQRTFASLEAKRLVKSRDDLNAVPYDRTKWYSVDLDEVRELEESFDQNERIVEHRKMKNGHRKVKDASAQDEPTIPDASLPDSSTSDTSTRGGAKPTSPRPRAVEVYRQERNLYPEESLWKTIGELVGDDPADIEFWRRVVHGCALCGYSPKNLDAALDYYERRQIPTTKPKTNGRGVPDLVPIVAGTAEERRADFTDAQWRRLNPLTRRAIISREAGRDFEQVQDDPEYDSACG